MKLFKNIHLSKFYKQKECQFHSELSTVNLTSEIGRSDSFGITFSNFNS